MQPDKMIHQANQIARFFASQPGGDQANRIAGHLRDFWAPDMRRQLAELIARGFTGFDPLVLDAAKILTPPAKA